MDVRFCYCGLPLEIKWGVLACPRHSTDFIKREKIEKRGKYSGKSHRPYGQYEKY